MLRKVVLEEQKSTINIKELESASRDHMIFITLMGTDEIIGSIINFTTTWFAYIRSAWLATHSNSSLENLVRSMRNLGYDVYIKDIENI